MRKIPPVFVAGALAASTLAASREVDALGTPLTLEVAIKSRFGTNIYALGKPARSRPGGPRRRVYLRLPWGVDGEYFFGGSEDLPLGGVPTHQSAHSVKYGVQVGYNIGIHSITIRPQLGVGNFTQTVDESVAGVSLSSTNRSSLQTRRRSRILKRSAGTRNAREARSRCCSHHSALRHGGGRSTSRGNDLLSSRSLRAFPGSWPRTPGF